MKNKYIITLFFAIVAASSLQARHWRRGGWGWGGWGPGVGVGFTVPIGGSSPKYIVPVESGDPYTRYQTLFPKSNPLKKPEIYQRWLFSNYPKSAANYWWNQFANRYNIYQETKPRSSAYFSVGTGGYWGGYPYWGGWGYPGYWGRPGVSFGFGF
jgi:hypothetical protein